MANRGKRSERLHQKVARAIGTAIVSGQYQPGAAFEGEIENCARFGVSRGAYREALRILIAKGLLESRPRMGTHVTAKDRWNLLDPDVLAWMFSLEPDPVFVRDLFELRGIIEPAAAELAAVRRSDEQLASMRSALDVMGDKGLSTDEGRAADQSFHRLILEATHNGALVTLAGSVGAAVRWTTHFKHRARKNPRDPLTDHTELFRAIEARDAHLARERMSELIRLALEDMDVDTLLA